MHPTNGDPGDRRGGGPKPVGLLVRLAYQSLEDFKLRFAPNLSRGGVFIRTREPRPIGTAVAFELRLASGEKVLRGDGVVRSVESEDLSSTPPRLPGMAIQFTRLDATSRALVEAMVGPREAGSRTPPTSSRPALTPLSTFEIPLPVEPVPISRPSNAIIGIDLGTTNACAAVVRDGRPYLIPSREGYRTIPSTVALTSRQTLVVGHLARAQLLTHPAGTIHGAKRLLGRSFDSAVAEEMRGRYPYEIVPDASGLAAVRLGTLTVTIEQLAALILREVKELAQNHLGEEVNRAVLTVPAYYNDRQRQAIRHAAGLAGLRVERILNEPTAAALAYAWGRHLQQRVLVYDLGGATFDASVLELQDTVYEVVSTGGDHFLGGVDFDERITASLLREYAQQVGAEFDGDPVARSRLGDAAERAKCALSERASYPLQLPFLALHEGKPVMFEALLTRAEIEKLVEPLVDRTIEVCREVLRTRGLSVQDIDEVILVGGQSRMPLVHQKVAAFFCKEPTRAVQPDEAVALGAALLAQSLEGSETVVLIDMLPVSIGVALPDGKVKTIIDRDTALPVRKQYGLSTSRDGQTEFELVVVQGESELASECDYLGTLSLTDLPPGPRGMVKISVTFELGAECLLSVTARELHTQRQVSVVLSTGAAPAMSSGLHPAVSPSSTGTRPLRADTQAPGPGRGGDRLFGRLRRFLGGEDAGVDDRDE